MPARKRTTSGTSTVPLDAIAASRLGLPGGDVGQRSA
jgi:hypothetical protein